MGTVLVAICFAGEMIHLQKCDMKLVELGVSLQQGPDTLTNTWFCGHAVACETVCDPLPRNPKFIALKVKPARVCLEN